MTTSLSTLRRQGETLIEATNANDEWTRADLEFVVATTDDAPDHEIALALGRSLYAVATIQKRLRREGVEAILANAHDRRVGRESRATTCDTCWTIVSASGTCLC